MFRPPLTALKGRKIGRSMSAIASRGMPLVNRREEVVPRQHGYDEQHDGR